MFREAFYPRHFFFGTRPAGAVPAAAQGGSPPCSGSRFAGHGTEWLIPVAARVESKLIRDSAKAELTSSPEATGLARPVFRKGWEIRL